MKKSFIFISCGLLFAGQLTFAGPIKDKFYEVLDQIDKTKLSDDERGKILHENIVRALRMTLMQQYNLCGAQDAKIAKEGYEVSELNPNLVYVQYEKFHGYYLFGTDPTKFLQVPMDSKIVIEPGTAVVHFYDSNCSQNSSSGSSSNK